MLENLMAFKQLGKGTTVANKNCIQNEIKSGLILGSTCSCSVRNIFVFLYAAQKCKD